MVDGQEKAVGETEQKRQNLEEVGMPRFIGVTPLSMGHTVRAEDPSKNVARVAVGVRWVRRGHDSNNARQFLRTHSNTFHEPRPLLSGTEQPRPCLPPAHGPLVFLSILARIAMRLNHHLRVFAGSLEGAKRTY